MILIFCKYFLSFLLYAFIGWVAEVINAYIKHKKFVNRGFMIGPYCPIYGFGCMAITFFLKNYTSNFIVLFILAMVVCMILEYLTSYIMEKLFNARWWDYSNQKFNINGRICLETAIPFGLGGLVIMYIINPFVMGIINKFSDKIVLILGIILFIIFITDFCISMVVIFKFRNVELSEIKDSTEEMTKKVKEYLINHSIFTKRLVKSYPNAKIRIDKYIKKYEMKKKNAINK